MPNETCPPWHLPCIGYSFVVLTVPPCPSCVANTLQRTPAVSCRCGNSYVLQGQPVLESKLRPFDLSRPKEYVLSLPSIRPVFLNPKSLVCAPFHLLGSAQKTDRCRKNHPMGSLFFKAIRRPRLRRLGLAGPQESSPGSREQQPASHCLSNRRDCCRVGASQHGRTGLTKAISHCQVTNGVYCGFCPQPNKISRDPTNLEASSHKQYSNPK